MKFTTSHKYAHLSSFDEYIIIGDVHGCVDELQQLLIQNGFSIDANGFIELNSTICSKSIVLLGDFIDKGNREKIIETINFIYKNYYHLNQHHQQFYLLKGNHEEMVYRYISNDPTLEITAKRLEDKDKYYNTVAILEKDFDLKKKFLELYDESYTWLQYRFSPNFSAILTHAPCEVKYLGQNDDESYAKMIKCASRSKNKGIKLDELLSYVYEEAEENQNYHIFGHLSQPNIRKYKNRVCIDTSVIYGDTLSCAIIKEDQLTFDSTPFQKKQKSATQEYNILFDF